MCFACAMRSFRALTPTDRDTFSHVGAVGTFAAGKLTEAFPVDGVGDLKPPVTAPALLTTDNVPDAADTAGSSNPVLTVTPPGTTTPTVSTIDTIGDLDFYRVTLTAGVAYEFGLYSYNGGPNLVGLTDPYLELYAADGSTLLVSADGGADTVYNQVNSGFDVLLVYTPTTSGTFYVNARAFSNSPATAEGDSVGDYELFAREQDLTDPNVYRPYYEPTEPLYAIDWGTQVDRVNTTARNPDGDEGMRDTGNVQGTPTYSNEFDVAALAAAQGADITGKNVITIYFARPGDVFVSNDPTNPGLPPATITAVAIQDFERTAVWTSLAEFAKVADVVYLEVDNRDHADFIYTSYTGTPGPGISLLGSMSPPGESDEGLAQFNSGDYRWNATDLQQGGFSFVTLIHEFGHGHGLAHPHDNGGRSGIMNGVEQESPTSVANYTTGDFELNQGVFTMMSYEDGWQSSPYGNAPTDVGYGYLGGLMAFDIAAIQDKYGVNEDWATGNDIYTLKDANAAGTYFTSIWDGGGTDSIVYSGERDTTIDLRAATLRYEAGGGGRVSYAQGIFGGFTIASGVAIEIARGGGGNDTLIGNEVANLLYGSAGNDILTAHEGDDTLDGGAGTDTMTGGLGNDWFYVNSSIDLVNETAGQGTDRIFTSSNYVLAAGISIETLSTDFAAATTAITLIGNELANNVYGNYGNNSLYGSGGNDTLIAHDGDDTLNGGLGTDSMWGGLGNDWFYVNSSTDGVNETAGQGTDRIFTSSNYVLAAGASIETLSTDFAGGTTAITLIGNELANNLYGNFGNNSLFGSSGNDTLIAHDGADLLNGGEGADSLTGGVGPDTFVFADTAGPGNIDSIGDYVVADDVIHIDNAVFTGLAAGALAAGAFRTGVAAADADDRVVYNSATGALWFDADGNGSGAAVQFATLATGLAMTAGEFTVI